MRIASPLRRTLAAASLALPMILGACSSPLGAGHGCAAGDACQDGLACVDPADTFVTSNDAGCIGGTLHGLTICTATCTKDADCAELGMDVVCAPNGCGPTGICLPQSDAGVTAGKR